MNFPTVNTVTHAPYLSIYSQCAPKIATKSRRRYSRQSATVGCRKVRRLFTRHLHTPQSLLRTPSQIKLIPSYNSETDMAIS